MSQFLQLGSDCFEVGSRLCQLLPAVMHAADDVVRRHDVTARQFGGVGPVEVFVGRWVCDTLNDLCRQASFAVSFQKHYLLERTLPHHKHYTFLRESSMIP